VLAECAKCGTLYAPDLEACPNCWSTERTGEMPKITGAGVSFPEGHAPGDGEEHVHPVAEPPTVAEAEAEVAQAAADLAAAEQAPAPAHAPVAPPRRPPRAAGE
jgi:uncharacterized OB-fold protein